MPWTSCISMRDGVGRSSQYPPHGVHGARRCRSRASHPRRCTPPHSGQRSLALATQPSTANTTALRSRKPITRAPIAPRGGPASCGFSCRAHRTRATHRTNRSCRLEATPPTRLLGAQPLARTRSAWWAAVPRGNRGLDQQEQTPACGRSGPTQVPAPGPAVPPDAYAASSRPRSGTPHTPPHSRSRARAAAQTTPSRRPRIRDVVADAVEAPPQRLRTRIGGIHAHHPRMIPGRRSPG